VTDKVTEEDLVAMFGTTDLTSKPTKKAKPPKPTKAELNEEAGDYSLRLYSNFAKSKFKL